MLTEHVARDRIHRGQLQQRLHCLSLPSPCDTALALLSLCLISLISPFSLLQTRPAWLETTKSNISVTLFRASTRLCSVVSGYLQSGPYHPQISCNNVRPSPLPLSRQLGRPREQVVHLLNCKDFHKK